MPEQQVEKIAEISSEVEESNIEFVERDEFRQERLRDEARGGRRRRYRDAPEEGEESAGESGTWDTEAKPARTGEGEESRGEPGDSSDEPRRRRRRRGRGRGRGRSDETGSEERAPEREGARSEESRAPREPREPRESREPRGRGQSGRSRRQDPRRAPRDDFDDDGLEEIILDDPEDDSLDDRARDDDGDGDDGDGGERASGSGHKSIPSWDEAIGMIVDTNLAQRTDRRHSSGSQSRGNGSSRGGRPRGGRRRRKPS
jgi:ribonuclease E